MIGQVARKSVGPIAVFGRDEVQLIAIGRVQSGLN
jgi:hypothetical protein